MASTLTAVRRNLLRNLAHSNVCYSKFRGQYVHTTSSKLSRNIITSPVPDIELPSGNVASHILQKSGSWGHHTASECSVTGRRYTYSQLVDGASRWATMLGKIGMKKGDVLATVLTNCPEYPLVFLGSMMAGVVVTTVNPNYTAGEICHQLIQSYTKMVIYDPALTSTVDAALAQCTQSVHVVCNGASGKSGVLNLQHVFGDKTLSFSDQVELSGEENCLMPYSSGTTGPPKGVALSHNALSSNIAMFMTPLHFRTPIATATQQESFMVLLPIYHIYGLLTITLVGLTAGVKLVTVPKFDPNTFVDIIGTHKLNTLHVVPSLLNFLQHSPSVTADNMSRLENVLNGSAPVSQSVAESFRTKINKPIFYQEGYGMTEALVIMATPFGVERTGSRLQNLPNVKVKVVDMATGEELKAYQKGELLIKTPSMMSGYFQNPTATAETIDSEGWLHTGDVGHYDDEGFFTIVDRTKELIKVKGLQVSPSEIEDLLRRCPDIVDVGVVGVPNERLGEAPRAYVVTKGAMKEENIHLFLEGKIAPHKKLVGGVCFVKELPKNATGKVLRRELKKMAMEDKR